MDTVRGATTHRLQIEYCTNAILGQGAPFHLGLPQPIISFLLLIVILDYTLSLVFPVVPDFLQDSLETIIFFVMSRLLGMRFLTVSFYVTIINYC